MKPPQRKKPQQRLGPRMVGPLGAAASSMSKPSLTEGMSESLGACQVRRLRAGYDTKTAGARPPQIVDVVSGGFEWPLGYRLGRERPALRQIHEG